MLKLTPGCCSPVDLVLPARPNWSQTINFIEENDGRTHLVRLVGVQNRFGSVTICSYLSFVWRYLSHELLSGCFVRSRLGTNSKYYNKKSKERNYNWVSLRTLKLLQFLLFAGKNVSFFLKCGVQFSLPGQREGVAVSQILPPTYWGNQLLSS